MNLNRIFQRIFLSIFSTFALMDMAIAVSPQGEWVLVSSTPSLSDRSGWVPMLAVVNKSSADLKSVIIEGSYEEVAEFVRGFALQARKLLRGTYEATSKDQSELAWRLDPTKVENHIFYGLIFMVNLRYAIQNAGRVIAKTFKKSVKSQASDNIKLGELDAEEIEWLEGFDQLAKEPNPFVLSYLFKPGKDGYLRVVSAQSSEKLTEIIASSGDDSSR